MSPRSRQPSETPAPPATPPIARVEILWSENSAVPVRIFRSLALADTALAQAFATEPPPRGGAYDKTAFKIVWADGREHEGRVDVTRSIVRAASTTPGILRQHLRSVATWLRDKANTAPWWSHDERFERWAWGLELLRRLDADAAQPPPAVAGDAPEIGEHDDAGPHGGATDTSLHDATLLPWPPTRVAWLRARLDGRPHGVPADGERYPRTTNTDMRWVVNYISSALVHDVPTFPGDAHARIWDHWRALHESVEVLLRKGGPHDEYADNEGFWSIQLQSLIAVMTSSWGAPRNRAARLTFRLVGATGDPYPAWIQNLRGRSGVYIIRERQDDGTAPIVYVGQSSLDRLYETLTRHFQMWRRWKGFWRGQYAEGHDPGLTYDRAACEAAAIVTAPNAALELEAQLIARLRPRDNLLGQPPVEDVPF